jgi:hypothetical protein
MFFSNESEINEFSTEFPLVVDKYLTVTQQSKILGAKELLG